MALDLVESIDDPVSELAAMLVEIVRKQSDWRSPEELAELYGEFQTAIARSRLVSGNVSIPVLDHVPRRDGA